MMPTSCAAVQQFSASNPAARRWRSPSIRIPCRQRVWTAARGIHSGRMRLITRRSVVTDASPYQVVIPALVQATASAANNSGAPRALAYSLRKLLHHGRYRNSPHHRCRHDRDGIRRTRHRRPPHLLLVQFSQRHPRGPATVRATSQEQHGGGLDVVPDALWATPTEQPATRHRRREHLRNVRHRYQSHCRATEHPVTRPIWSHMSAVQLTDLSSHRLNLAGGASNADQASTQFDTDRCA
jgi:hypothetical protein